MFRAKLPSAEPMRTTSHFATSFLIIMFVPAQQHHGSSWRGAMPDRVGAALPPPLDQRPHAVPSRESVFLPLYPGYPCNLSNLRLQQTDTVYDLSSIAAETGRCPVVHHSPQIRMTVWTHALCLARPTPKRWTSRSSFLAHIRLPRVTSNSLTS